MNDYREKIRSYIDQEIEIVKRLDVDEINKAMNALEETRRKGHTVFICGNGGSASTASHFAGDFNKGVSEQYRQKYNFICLNDNITSMMAIANDFSYDDIFTIPLIGRLCPGDILMAISGSGNSKNIVKAAEYAKDQGNTVIGITGYSGGRLRELSDIDLHVPVNDMQIAEDLHLVLDHLMMRILAYEK